MPSGPKKRKAAKKKQSQGKGEQEPLEKHGGQHIKAEFANENTNNRDHSQQQLPISPNLQVVELHSETGNGHRLSEEQESQEARLSEEQEFKKLQDSNSMAATEEVVEIEQKQEQQEEETVETTAKEMEVSVEPALEVNEGVAQDGEVAEEAEVVAVESEPKSEPVIVETEEAPSLQEGPVVDQGETVAVSSQETEVKAAEEVAEPVEDSPAPTTEVVSRGLLAARQRTTWWDCCGLAEIFGASDR